MTEPPSKLAITVLLVEDNEVDSYLIQMVLRDVGFSKEPVVVDDGGPAIELLRQCSSESSLPDLVILDLNLKRVDGPEVLTFIRKTDYLKNLCVAILSSSPTDVMVAKAAAANGYFTKPNDLDSFMALGPQLRDCYLNCRSAGKAW